MMRFKALQKLFRQTVVPLLLILLSPQIVFIFWYTNVMLGGSLAKLSDLFIQNGFFYTLKTIWEPYYLGTPAAWKILGVFVFVQLSLMRLVPGKLFKGPISPFGNVPVYPANGVLCYVITLILFYLGAFQFKLFSPAILYDNFPGLLGSLNLFSVFFCLFLAFKGLLWPSSNDAGSSGNLIFDFYWGTELYPRIFGWDVKQFTNCRFALMSWPLLLISFAAKQSELYGLSNSMVIAVALQLIYITKFFIWETGYLCSLDIMHDRAGFYICWGCLVWVPGIYTSPTLYLVHHPNHLSLPIALTILVLGISSILINYFADRQRQKVRVLNGVCKVWGKEPVITIARYTTAQGDLKQNLLLASGWWGISRHFHYIPELLSAFFWTVPALFENVLPYFYVIYLALVLLERAFRDDRRCSLKYGKDWQSYCEKVPYKILPYII